MNSRSRPTKRSRPGPSRPSGPWKHGAIPVIGVIGEIGAGKSAASASLEARGAFVIDADAVGHALLNQRPVRDEVIARFGPGILAPAADPGEPPLIDRRALGAIVFAAPSALADLETIMHPKMRRTFERAIARTVRRGQARAVVLDAAILLEAGWEALCDRVVYIDTPRDRRLARLHAQRGWTEETLLARERSQWPAEKKRSRADVVVANDAGPDALEHGLGSFWESLPGLARPAEPPRGGPGGARGRSPRTPRET